jgi:photosystem II stability/assembly factor-like uncharacterized protein
VDIKLEREVVMSIVWNEVQPAGDVDVLWYPVCSDEDGSHLCAGVFGGRLYQSKDFGETWNELRPLGIDEDKNWCTLSCSADGRNILAAVEGGRVYYSSNEGVTWGEVFPTGAAANKNWYCSLMSDNGTVLAIGVYATGRLYTSFDAGVTWAERKPAGDVDRNWSGLACSPTGIDMIACDQAGRVWLSRDYGQSWSETRPKGDVVGNWYAVDCSPDFVHLIAVEYNGGVYVSDDSGENWVQCSIPTDDYLYRTCGISPNGEIAIAAARIGAVGGRVLSTIDGGSNWIVEDPNNIGLANWSVMAHSRDFSRLIIGCEHVTKGRLFLGVEDGQSLPPDPDPEVPQYLVPIESTDEMYKTSGHPTLPDGVVMTW